MRNLTSFETDTGTKIALQALNPRLLSIKPLGAKFEILDDNGKLIGLDYDGEYLISKGSIVQIGSQKYKIDTIEKGIAVKLQLQEHLLFHF